MASPIRSVPAALHRPPLRSGRRSARAAAPSPGCPASAAASALSLQVPTLAPLRPWCLLPRRRRRSARAALPFRPALHRPPLRHSLSRYLHSPLRSLTSASPFADATSLVTATAATPLVAAAGPRVSPTYPACLGFCFRLKARCSTVFAWEEVSCSARSSVWSTGSRTTSCLNARLASNRSPWRNHVASTACKCDSKALCFPSDPTEGTFVHTVMTESNICQGPCILYGYLPAFMMQMCVCSKIMEIAFH